MKKLHAGVHGAVMCLLAVVATAQGSGSWDGLVEVKPKRLDAAYLRPGVDFRPYTKLMIDPSEVAFHKDWMKRYNASTGLSHRLTQQDAERIAAETRNTARLALSNSVTNLRDFRTLFKQWAAICVKAFEDLRAMSPVPEHLKPGQKPQ